MLPWLEDDVLSTSGVCHIYTPTLYFFCTLLLQTANPC